MTPMLDLWCCCTHPWGTVLSFLSFFFFTFFSLLLSLCHYYWSISRFTDSPFVISILWLSPSVNLLFQIFYFSVLELPFVSVHKFCFSAETSYTFIHCEYIFIVLIVTLKTSSTNSNIWIISVFSLENGHIFLFLHWLNKFGWYLIQYGRCGMESLVSVIFCLFEQATDLVGLRLKSSAGSSLSLYSGSFVLN